MSHRHDDTPNPARRALLRRIGLAAGAIYVAPALLQIASAQASTVSRASRPASRAQSGRRMPSRASRPSRPVRGRKVSRPSRPRRR